MKIFINKDLEKLFKKRGSYVFCRRKDLNKLSLNEKIYFVGNSLKDLQIARSLDFVSIIINTSKLKPVKGKATPDYFIDNISQVKKINNRKSDQIIFNEIHVSKSPKFKDLNSKEKVLLQDHFRRIQQHSLVTGEFMRLQAIVLNEDSDLWNTTGVLHDIDYGKTYFNTKGHGFDSKPILVKYNLNKNLIDAITYHTIPKYCKTKFLLGWSTYISEMFTKRFVHTMRKKGCIDPSGVTFDDFLTVYKGNDFRKNERLTRFEDSSMLWGEFKLMMEEHDKTIHNFPIPKETLFSLCQKAFHELNVFPLGITHLKETSIIKLLAN